jgi:acyl dehydratase
MAVLLLFGLVGIVVFSLFLRSGHRLTSILRGSKHATIDFSPHELRLGEVALAIFSMMIRSAVNHVHGPNPESNTSTLDELTLSSTFHITKGDITRYIDAVGQKRDKSIDLAPSATLLFLSTVTEPAMLLLLASPRCPINPLGAVNVRNRFDLLRPDLCQPKSFLINRGAVLSARLRKESRLAKRGIEFDLEATIMAPDKDKGRNAELIPVFRQVFTMLEFEKTKGGAKNTTASVKHVESRTVDTQTIPLRVWLSRNDPLRWASLCKDYNFIHLSGLAARLFGLPGKLAHGNHVVAKAMHILEGSDGMQERNEPITWMEVQFRRPVVVPSNLLFEAPSTTGDIMRLSIYSIRGEHIAVEYGASSDLHM